MEFIRNTIEFALHFDEYLAQIIAQYGAWTLAFLFIIIFMETGLVVTPFLPGDSLLFAAGAFAARGALNVWAVFILLSIAAVLGDTVNYWIGHKIGAKAYRGEVRWIKKGYMERTHAFFEKHGGNMGASGAVGTSGAGAVAVVVPRTTLPTQAALGVRVPSSRAAWKMSGGPALF